MAKTLEQWIARYNQKVPEGFKRNERFALFFDPEKGFAEVYVNDHLVMVNQVCGEFNYWREVAGKLARHFGIKQVCTAFVRPILPYIRLAGFEPYRIDETSQGKKYFCKDKRTGQKGVASPGGKDTYYVTWEVTDDEL